VAVLLPPAIARIKRDFPQVSVHLQQSAEGAALDLLGSGEADMAVFSTVGAEPPGGVAVPARSSPCAMSGQPSA
jgi:DNA-binding transcriptional LysR family regulator